VLVTHEHWDHVSGFSTQQAQDLFDEIEIDAVWYAWTEDPSPTNKLGHKLRREREAKAAAVHRAAIAMGKIGEPFAVDRTQRISALLSAILDPKCVATLRRQDMNPEHLDHLTWPPNLSTGRLEPTSKSPEKDNEASGCTKPRKFWA
jgi:hypothetical protein